jgi:HPt (histidine-containing phosphotransfer) domain-containing protein
MGAGRRAHSPATGGDIISVNTLGQKEAYCAKLEFACRKQALVEQASLAVEEERQWVCTVVQQHCPTGGAPLVTAAYRSIAIAPCLRCQGI